METPIHSILMGIGNSQRGDDGVGSFLARAFQAPGWLSLDCGTVPENYTSLVKRHTPDDLVLVDAAQMNCAPGALRRLAAAQVMDRGLGTHALPLSLTIQYLQPWVKHPILFIGIQPKTVGEVEGLSPELEQAAREIMPLLVARHFDLIPIL